MNKDTLIGLIKAKKPSIEMLKIAEKVAEFETTLRAAGIPSLHTLDSSGWIDGQTSCDIPTTCTAIRKVYITGYQDPIPMTMSQDDAYAGNAQDDDCCYVDSKGKIYFSFPIKSSGTALVIKIDCNKFDATNTTIEKLPDRLLLAAMHYCLHAYYTDDETFNDAKATYHHGMYTREMNANQYVPTSEYQFGIGGDL